VPKVLDGLGYDRLQVRLDNLLVPPYCTSCPVSFLSQTNLSPRDWLE
jgi:hypothetical protein